MYWLLAISIPWALIQTTIYLSVNISFLQKYSRATRAIYAVLANTFPIALFISVLESELRGAPPPFHYLLAITAVTSGIFSFLFVQAKNMSEMKQAKTVTPIDAEEPAESCDGTPLFWRVHTAKFGKNILHVSAQDHYVQVTTCRGSTLILMRFTDVLLQLNVIEGAQVHRSHWVSKNSTVKIEKSNGKLSLLLQNGTNVPISKSRCNELKKISWFAKMYAST
ncbi:LytTR family DNA-binding domain-containing protein [Polycladidibacter stylochi]|uniref:LytTR family DNA-binding domain-containing protein n=1 Tax=Polycladidibacter stylochi TaxID=1807766 RepID=UPI00138F4985|nr:LytTR family DNA-binding domain-containing protein [Pseudovibrio stylochi]